MENMEIYEKLKQASISGGSVNRNGKCVMIPNAFKMAKENFLAAGAFASQLLIGGSIYGENVETTSNDSKGLGGK